MDNNSPNPIPPKPPAKTNTYRGLKIAMIITAVFVFLTGGLYAFLARPEYLPKISLQKDARYTLQKFGSEEEFREYIDIGTDTYADFGSFLGGPPSLPIEQSLDESLRLEPSQLRSDGEGAGRVSQTNIQVADVDEPDILKTNGKEIFFSREQRFYIQERVEDVDVSSNVILPPDRRDDATVQVINAYPPSDLSEITAIKKSGEMLLSDNDLVIFSDDNKNIYGYDVTSKTNPQEKWSLGLDDEVNSTLVTARLFERKVYLIARTNNYSNNPCPIPLTTGSARISVPCTEIYRPNSRILADSTYTIMILDPATGKVEKKISFVGSLGHSVVYMSKENIYVTYPQAQNMIEVFSNFLTTKGKGLLPEDLATKVASLKDLDISEAAKFTELEIVLENYTNSLGKDERLKLENDLYDRLGDYIRENIRDIQTTGIVKISTDSLDIESTGGVPGTLLNQFALDEHENYLRVATTIAGGVFGSSANSANDVVVLDNNLREVGSVKNLGLDERIYSVRFLGDRGYVVTFKQIDPFYVLDLSDPKNPRRVGELKIPGYSSYLHELKENLILGVGKEGSKVKLSLFDVSNPVSPREIDKYELDEFWSEILSTHKAFLLDPKFNIFFVPGGKGGYVFSFENSTLSLIKAVSDYQVKRALFLDDYLYIVGENQISVLDQNTYETIKTLDI